MTGNIEWVFKKELNPSIGAQKICCNCPIGQVKLADHEALIWHPILVIIQVKTKLCDMKFFLTYPSV